MHPVQDIRRGGSSLVYFVSLLESEHGYVRMCIFVKVLKIILLKGFEEVNKIHAI